MKICCIMNNWVVYCMMYCNLTCWCTLRPWRPWHCENLHPVESKMVNSPGFFQFLNCYNSAASRSICWNLVEFDHMTAIHYKRSESKCHMWCNISAVTCCKSGTDSLTDFKQALHVEHGMWCLFNVSRSNRLQIEMYNLCSVQQTKTHENLLITTLMFSFRNWCRWI